MSKEDLENKFKDLENHILKLGIKYIEPHYIEPNKVPSENPNDYKLDVNSFCILCHAAFEEFLEDVTLYSIERIDKEFNSRNGKMSFATICLLHFDGHPLGLTEDKKWDSTYLKDYFASRLAERKSELSKYATQENHGIDVKYLRKLLLPIGIDVPRDPKELSALSNLKNIRGIYAHSYARNNKPLAPEDAEKAVDDVLGMVTKIKDKALSMSYYVI